MKSGSELIAGNVGSEPLADPGVESGPGEGVLSLRQALMLMHRGMDYWVMHMTDNRPLWVTGMPVRKNGGQAIMGSWQFFTLSQGGVQIEARAEKDCGIPWNEESMFLVSCGILQWSGDRVKPQLTVLQVGQQTGRRRQSGDEKYAEWEGAIRQAKRDVGLLFQKDRISVVVVTSEAGEAWMDITEPLREFSGLLELERVGVPMTVPGAVTHSLEMIGQRAVPPDLVIVARGGGQGLEALDDPKVLAVVTQRAFPVVTAIGHARDRLVIDLIADKSFATPRECGLWLRGQCEEKRLRDLDQQYVTHQNALQKAKEIETLVGALGQDKASLQLEVRILRWALVGVIILAAWLWLTA